VQGPKQGFKQIKRHYKKIIEIPESWDVERLGKLCKLRKDGKITSDLYIGLEHISSGSNTLEGKGNVSEFSSTKNEFYEGDILYGKLRPLLNKVWLATESGYCSTDILPIVSSKKILNRMLLLILSNHHFYSYAVGTSAGTKMPRTNWPDIKKFIVFLPSIPEQQKISSILSNVNNLIDSYSKVITTTKKFKKGLMNQFFTKGIGHKKFKKVNFGGQIIENIPMNWNVKTLKDISKDGTQNGLAISVSDYGSGIPIVGMTKFYASEILTLDNMKEVNISKKDEETFSLRSFDLLFGRRSMDGKAIGAAGKCIVMPKINKKIIFESSIIRMSVKNEISPFFIYQLLKSHLGEKLMRRIIRVSAVSGITGGDLIKIKIPFPPKEEREKIVSILNLIDSKISELESQKYHFEIVKKGLVQRFLTGQIRVQ